MNETLLKLVWAVFLGALPLSVVHAIALSAVRKSGTEHFPAWLCRLRQVINILIGLGLILLTASLAARWAEGGYPPFSNIPESLLWMAWAFCGVYLVSRRFADFAAMELWGCVGVLCILACSSLLDQSPRPLMPALQSNWMIFHVFTCMLSYGAFFAAFWTAVLWLTIWRKRESGKMVDRLTCQMIAFGFLLLTIGIVSGAVWAKQAWGRYWGWDPKETWALITWFVYGIHLHLRRIAGPLGLPRERLPLLNAVFALFGFAVTLFTYFGVNYLLPSLHSYP